jgi:type II secretory pathway component PulK
MGPSCTGRRHSRGQAMIEVLLILVLVVFVFGASTDNPLTKLGDAIRKRYADYTESISRP